MSNYLISEEEIKKYEEEFNNYWQGGLPDKRSFINFKSLSNEEEKIVVAELINFMFYYKTNQQVVEKYLLDKEREINIFSILDFWYYEIGKPQNLENILQDIAVYSDCVSYYEDTEKVVDIFMHYFPLKRIFRKSLYRTERQAEELNFILRNGSRQQKKELCEYFADYNVDENHISQKMAEEILNYIRMVK